MYRRTIQDTPSFCHFEYHSLCKVALTTSLLDFTQKSENITNYTEFFHYFKSFVIRLPFYIFEHFETGNRHVSNMRPYIL